MESFLSVRLKLSFLSKERSERSKDLEESFLSVRLKLSLLSKERSERSKDLEESFLSERLKLSFLSKERSDLSNLLKESFLSKDLEESFLSNERPPLPKDFSELSFERKELFSPRKGGLSENFLDPNDLFSRLSSFLKEPLSDWSFDPYDFFPKLLFLSPLDLKLSELPRDFLELSSRLFLLLLNGIVFC